MQALKQAISFIDQVSTVMGLRVMIREASELTKADVVREMRAKSVNLIFEGTRFFFS